MPRISQHIGDWSLLDDLSAVHDHDSIRDLAEHAEVVCDVYDRNTGSIGKALDRSEHTGLSDDIESGGGFIQYQNRRFTDHRHGDGYALLLSS